MYDVCYFLPVCLQTHSTPFPQSALYHREPMAQLPSQLASGGPSRRSDSRAIRRPVSVTSSVLQEASLAVVRAARLLQLPQAAPLRVGVDSGLWSYSLHNLTLWPQQGKWLPICADLWMASQSPVCSSETVVTSSLY